MVDSYNTDVRFSKDFNFGTVDLQFFVQINNVFNDKKLSSTGFSRDNFDRDRYFESLHLPESAVDDQFKYVNVPGDDQPGDYRDYTITYTPIKAVRDIANTTSPTNGLIYYDETSKGYYEFVNASWQVVDSSRMDKIIKDKSYIDMPNLGFFTFLNPRDIYFGLKFNISL